MTWLRVVLFMTPEGRLDVVAYPFDQENVCKLQLARVAEHYGPAYLAARCEYHATL